VIGLGRLNVTGRSAAGFVRKGRFGARFGIHFTLTPVKSEKWPEIKSPLSPNPDQLSTAIEFPLLRLSRPIQTTVRLRESGS
jgi:hypothetical protein